MLETRNVHHLHHGVENAATWEDVWVVHLSNITYTPPQVFICYLYLLQHPFDFVQLMTLSLLDIVFDDINWILMHRCLQLSMAMSYWEKCEDFPNISCSENFNMIKDLSQEAWHFLCLMILGTEFQSILTLTQLLNPKLIILKLVEMSWI